MKILKDYINRLLLRYLFFIPKRNNNLSFISMRRIPLIVDCIEPTELCQIMYKSGSDKGMFSRIGMHNYTTFYHKLFNRFRNKNLRLFELGIGSNNENIESNMGIDGVPGASLRGWKEYFKNGAIFGADIDKDILFEEDRIKTFYCDQLNAESVNSMWLNEKDLTEQFDILIDDGLHTFEANKIFFLNSFYKLKQSGFYIIEDVVNKELENWRLFLRNYDLNCNNINYWIINIPSRKNKYDNNVVLIFY